MDESTADEPRQAPRPDGDAAGAEALRDDHVGRYSIRSLIGAGRTGRVYRAYDAELSRTVALKVMRRGVGDEREAQAFARLNHPNVVTIYDIGTEDGHLFMAMELVEGETLTEWLKRGARGWRQIQAVFLAVGRGLAAAHAAGIVHRDFQSQNVIVGKERVVVVDFGMAHAAAPGADPAAGAAVDDAQRPFCVALRDALQGRPTGTRDHEVPGWLQQVFGRGLSARPEDRWPSMPELLEALEHRFWTPRRRRLAALATGGAVLALGLAAFSLGRRVAAPDPCAGGATLVASLWDPGAQAETRESFRTTGRPYADATFTRVDASLRRRVAEWSDAHRLACEATYVHHEQSAALLDARMACLGRARLELAALVSLLRDADADRVDNATLAADRAGDVTACADLAALRDAVPAPRDPAAARELEEVRGAIAHLSALQLLGKFRDGLTTGPTVVARARALGYAPALAAALDLAEVFEVSAGSLDKAIEIGYEAARVAAEAGDDRLVARALDHVAFALAYGSRQFEAADVAYHSALTAAARAGNPVSLLSKIYGDRVQMMQFSGRDQAALALGLLVLQSDLWLYGASSYQVAQSLTEIANSVSRLGDPREARPFYERALTISETALGPEHPITVEIVGNAGMNRLDMLDYDGAARLYERALPATEQAYGADDWSVGIIAHNLGIARRGQRRLPEARALIERAIRIKIGKLGPKSPSVATSYDELGEIARLEGRVPEALTNITRAIAIQREAFGGPHPSLASSYRDQAELLVAMGQPAEARAAIAQASAIDDKVGGALGHHGQTLRIAADIERSARQPRAAIVLYQQALPLLEARNGLDGPGLLDALLGMGAAQLDAGDTADALATAERAAAIAEPDRVPADVHAAAQFLLCQARWAQGRDRAGAIATARSTRARLAALPYPSRLIAQIDRWLSGRAR